MKWAARPGPFVWADGRIYLHLLQSIFYIYYAKGRPTLYSGAPDGQSTTASYNLINARYNNFLK